MLCINTFGRVRYFPDQAKKKIQNGRTSTLIRNTYALANSTRRQIELGEEFETVYVLQPWSVIAHMHWKTCTGKSNIIQLLTHRHLTPWEYLKSE